LACGSPVARATESPYRESRFASRLTAIKRRHPRSQLGRLDKLFWVVIRQFWSQWKKNLIVVTPETVVRWHQTRFRLYWRLISKVKKPIGRRQTPKQVRQTSLRDIQIGQANTHLRKAGMPTIKRSSLTL
jgi:hypothetical protein